jgi:hypothetical protein
LSQRGEDDVGMAGEGVSGEARTACLSGRPGLLDLLQTFGFDSLDRETSDGEFVELTHEVEKTGRCEAVACLTMNQARGGGRIKGRQQECAMCRTAAARSFAE